MLSKKKKCIVCQKRIFQGELIKKHNSNFCSQQCLKEYELLLAKAKKVKLDDCC